MLLPKGKSAGHRGSDHQPSQGGTDLLSAAPFARATLELVRAEIIILKTLALLM